MTKATSTPNSSLILLKRQRSHLLLVLSNPKMDSEARFRSWYLGSFRQALNEVSGILCALLYEPHEVDVSGGKYPGLPSKFLALVDLGIDGAAAALPILEGIQALHREEDSAEEAATWLYYPASEQAGRDAVLKPSLLTLAFANAIPARESEFREFYATRHIRHALKIPALVSGQCFERTEFQNPGALEARFSMVALYQQEGSPESMVESFSSLPPGSLDFPAMDLTRFAEWVYRPLTPTEAK